MSEVNRNEDVASGPSGGIELEILRNKLQALTAELGTALANASPTPQVNLGRDYAVAIVDTAGRIVAIDNPLHLGSFAHMAPAMLEYFKFDMKDGDIVVSNDPYRGGMQVQDFTLAMPFVVNNTIVLYLVARAHMPDIGGLVSGNYCPTATEIWVEGVLISPVKIQRYGRPVRDILTTLLLNSRRPEETRRNLDVVIAALDLGRERLETIIDAHGTEGVRAALAYAQDYAERHARAAIKRWRKGEYEGTRTLDHDCAGGEPVSVRVKVTVADEEVVLDFSASDDQRPSFINSSLGNTASFALLPVFAALGDYIPYNSGVLRAVHIESRPGAITHAQRPAPVSWSQTHCGAEIIESVAGALRAAVPDPLGAFTVPNCLVLGRPSADRSTQRDFSAWGIGGCSGAPGADGWARPQTQSRSVLPSVEQWEVETQMPVQRLEFIEDSGGAGEWRGAPAVEAVISLLPDYVYTACVQGHENVAPGVMGGWPGSASQVEFISSDGVASTSSVLVETPISAQRLSLRFGGGGGYGDPLKRGRARVRDDVLDGYISSTAAREIYGLVDEALSTVSQHARG